MSYVYLLHFDQFIAPGRHSCRHYLGSADDLAVRIYQHRHYPDARLLQVAKERGIGFEVVRVWEVANARQLERQLKQRKDGPMLCPLCRNERKQKQWQLNLWDYWLDVFTLDDVPEMAF